MNRSSYGYTLVEVLLIVIVVGIIAGITTVTWNGVTKNYRDKARETDTRSWMASFENYKNRYFVYPTNPNPALGTPAGDVTACLGSFTSYSNKCGQFQSSVSTAYVDATGTNSTNVLTELTKIGNAPNNAGPSLNNALVGPIAFSYVTGSNPYTVTTQLINFFENSCPSDFTNINASLPASLANVLTALPSGSTANACALTKTFTYTTS